MIHVNSLILFQMFILHIPVRQKQYEVDTSSFGHTSPDRYSTIKPSNFSSKQFDCFDILYSFPKKKYFPLSKHNIQKYIKEDGAYGSMIVDCNLKKKTYANSCNCLCFVCSLVGKGLHHPSWRVCVEHQILLRSNPGWK